MQKWIVSLTFIFGWLPMLTLLILGFRGGLDSVALLSHHPWHGAGFISLICAEILVFWALSSLSFGLKLNFFIRFVFLCIGALALGGLGIVGLVQWQNLPADSIVIWQLLAAGWLFAGPLVVVVLHAIAHFKALNKLVNQERKKAK